MKRTNQIYLFLIVFLLAVNLSYGQQFFEQYQGLDEYQGYQNDYFAEDSARFSYEPDYGENMDYGNDGIGNPGDKVPVDDYIFLLPILAIFIGSYYLIKAKKPSCQ